MVKMDLNAVKLEPSQHGNIRAKAPNPKTNSKRKTVDNSKQKHQNMKLDIARLEVILTGISNAISKMPHRFGPRQVEPLEVSSDDALNDIDLGQEDTLWNSQDGDTLDSFNRDLNVSTTDLMDFSNSIADCLDFFANNHSNSYSYNSTEEFENGAVSELKIDYSDFFGEDAENVNGVSNLKRTEVIEDLAEYLLHETRYVVVLLLIDSVGCLGS